MVTCDICCGKFCKPLGNIISMQDPVGYPWEGCMLSHFSHKPFSLCYCLGTSVKRWEDVAWFVPTCRGQVGNVQHMERWGGRSWCQSRDWSKRFPKTEWTFWSCLVSFWTSPFWVPSSSLSPFPWFHVEDHVCLLDCIVVDLQDMDIFAAERHPREYSRVSENSSGDGCRRKGQERQSLWQITVWFRGQPQARADLLASLSSVYVPWKLGTSLKRKKRKGNFEWLTLKPEMTKDSRKWRRFCFLPLVKMGLNIYVFNIRLLNNYYVPASVLDTWDITGAEICALNKHHPWKPTQREMIGRVGWVRYLQYWIECSKMASFWRSDLHRHLIEARRLANLFWDRVFQGKATTWAKVLEKAKA